MPTRRTVGRNVLRKEGHDKVTGRARYIDDIRFEDVLYVRTIRSSVAAGEIADVRYDFDRTGFTIVDHRDIPGRNVVALIDEDQPSLAATRVRHVAEPVVLLAHSDRTRRATAEVAITYRETTPSSIPNVPTCRSSRSRAQLGQVSVADCGHQVLVGHGRHL